MPEFGPNCVTRNEALHRFEMIEEGLTVFADYHLSGGKVVIPHVEAPILLRGRGAAGRFMQGLAEKARAEDFKIVPVCSYAVAWFRRHPQWADVLA